MVLCHHSLGDPENSHHHEGLLQREEQDSAGQFLQWIVLALALAVL